MAPGFRFAETMSGSFVLGDDPGTTRRFSFSIEARAPSLWRHLRSGGETELSGTLDAEGFADGVPIHGTLTLAVLTRRLIRYQFDFTANDGADYRFAGQKDIRLGDLRGSFTTLPGVITDAAGRAVAAVETRFDLGSDWLAFVSSWRPA